MKGQIMKLKSMLVGATLVLAVNPPSIFAQNLFEADYGSGHIYQFAPDGMRSTFASGLNGPFALAFDDAGDLFVANYWGGTVTKITPCGNQSVFASGLSGPDGLAFNSAGSLF